MRMIPIAAAALGSVSAASAHDFWLEPEKFTVEAGETVTLRFTIGHAGAHEPWNLQLDKVAGLRSCLAGLCSPESGIVPNAPDARGRARVDLKGEGTYVLAFESRPSFSALDGPAFTDYARKEGLTAILADRDARGTAHAPGRELYSRRAKTLVRAGAGPLGEVSAAVGQTLEIIPLKNPYALTAGESLPVRVLFNGAPLRGATIDLDDLSDQREPLQSMVTNAEGEAAFSVEGAGPFKLMTIWGVPLEDRRRADYETFFASLTFGR